MGNVVACQHCHGNGKVTVWNNKEKDLRGAALSGVWWLRQGEQEAHLIH